MHSLHVGHVGLMGNLHYLEIVDFVLGIPGWDITGDDKATWLAQQRAAEQAVAALPDAPTPPSSSPPRRSARKTHGTTGTASLDWRP